MNLPKKRSPVVQQPIPNHPTSIHTKTKEQKTQRSISLGTPVRILRGHLRGCTAKIVGSTNDGVFFIQKDLDSRQKGIAQSPDGPFLGNEFEILN